ncbi:LuxR C-terminal-related transcriptional regulator, partial [Streptomyces sp. NPDC058425]|uniref:helix-turn-helix transcriptional regulator n=1 Tax=Streptomyces sp. NPDC058425 TaxID=3346492 RepID=UPI00365E99AC
GPPPPPPYPPPPGAARGPAPGRGGGAGAPGRPPRATALTGSREATARLYARADESAADLEATAPWYYARYQADHAAFLAAAGHRREAVDRYRAAWTVAGRVGAEPLRARCAAGLGALRMPERAHPFALTARETEVARLVSSGLTNRETAARLFVTPASVGFHLSNIYGKLGIRSRYELRAWWSNREDT